MNAQSLIRLAVGRKGLLSNLESIVGAVIAGAGILAVQRLGYTVSEERIYAALGAGVLLGNQLFGNLECFRRADKAIFGDLPHEGPGTSDSLTDASK
jgi:hypothetical protein